MQSQLATSPCSPSAQSPTRSPGPQGRVQGRALWPCTSPRSPGKPSLPPNKAVAGVGVQVPTSSSPLTSRGAPASPASPVASPSPRPMNAPLQALVKAAAQARVMPAAPADLSEVNARLAGTQSWPALQVLAMQYQGRLDQRSVVAVLQRAAQLAGSLSPSSEPSQSEQYACARLLESVAMSCAHLIPTMSPTTVAAVLGSLGTLAVSGIVSMRQVPYMVVVLVQALVLASLPQLGTYSPPQLAYVLRGCALLSPTGLPEVWLDEWQAATPRAVLAAMPPDALDAVIAALQALYTRQSWLPADAWLADLLRAAEGRLGEYGGRQLRSLAVALAGLELRPAAGWLGSFRAAFDAAVGGARVEADDVAGVLYALTKLEVAFP